MIGLHHIRAGARNAFISAADSLGYSIIPQWRLPGRAHAHLLASLFASLEVDCVLDVGANRGGFHDFLRTEVGFEGRIISFEPVAELAAECRDKAAQTDTRWNVMETAIGNEDRSRMINVMERDRLSSFLEPDDSEMTARKFGREFVSGGTKAEVPVRRLASLLPELRAKMRFSNPFLKTDTQGYDLEVIEGCGEELASIAAIQSELSVIPIYKSAPSWMQLIERLSRNGFHVSGLFPVSQDENFRIIEFDGVFVR